MYKKTIFLFIFLIVNFCLNIFQPSIKNEQLKELKNSFFVITLSPDGNTNMVYLKNIKNIRNHKNTSLVNMDGK